MSFHSAGNLRKPKSFNDSKKRPKVQRLDEIPHKGKFSIRSKEKGSTVRTMRKALSSIVFGPKSKRIPSKFSKDGGLKRLRCMKEHTSVEMTSNTRFKRLQLGPTKDGPLVSASSQDMKFRCHGGITLPDVDGAKTHDLKAVEVSNDSGNSWNLAFHWLSKLQSPYTLCIWLVSTPPPLPSPGRVSFMSIVVYVQLFFLG